MKNSWNWSRTICSVTIWVVVGWIICSIASCTAKCKQAEYNMMQNMKGRAVW